MAKDWLDWLNFADQEHCHWAARYLGQRGYSVAPTSNWQSFQQHLRTLTANWPARNLASQMPHNPAHSPYVVLELRMRSAYFQWKKRREDKAFSTYNLRMRKDLRPFLHRLSKRQQMTISQAIEDLVRREDEMSRDFSRELDQQLKKVRQDAEYKVEAEKLRSRQYHNVITQLINRAARLELQLEGLTMSDAATQDDREAFEEMLNERAQDIGKQYQAELSRIPRPPRRPRPTVSRTSPAPDNETL
ncbi:hypothetical protein [Alloalcanivorax xenomutans]|uniref:Uncharacterized protein n=1 Tax=Alloalcanivorax xenomutans TaxID=1094342 RepID=A0A9Q3ZHB9_9GAMM|nr:hypothetical protein [Alloalcanivorax xenomutans]MCE7510704.1 hypothetical protein [Alloalcanivorax xenomutans]